MAPACAACVADIALGAWGEKHARRHGSSTARAVGRRVCGRWERLSAGVSGSVLSSTKYPISVYVQVARKCFIGGCGTLVLRVHRRGGPRMQRDSDGQIRRGKSSSLFAVSSDGRLRQSTIRRGGEREISCFGMKEDEAVEQRPQLLQASRDSANLAGARKEPVEPWNTKRAPPSRSYCAAGRISGQQRHGNGFCVCVLFAPPALFQEQCVAHEFFLPDGWPDTGTSIGVNPGVVAILSAQCVATEKSADA